MLSAGLHTEKKLEQMLVEYIKDGQVIAVGTGKIGESLLKKLALRVEAKDLNVSIVPTSYRFTKLCHEFHLPLANINDQEIDVGIDFASSVDKQFNFIKLDSTSFVRDNMIALSALELIVICEENKYKEKIERLVPMEVVEFGLKKTVLHLQSLGEATLRVKNGEPVKTETGNFIVDVKVDKVFDLEDIEVEAKKIPGVIETGLFIGYADRVILHGPKKGYYVQSRIQGEEWHPPCPKGQGFHLLMDWF